MQWSKMQMSSKSKAKYLLKLNLFHNDFFADLLACLMLNENKHLRRTSETVQSITNATHFHCWDE